jgi:hypothetical protein
MGAINGLYTYFRVWAILLKFVAEKEIKSGAVLRPWSSKALHNVLKLLSFNFALGNARREVVVLRWCMCEPNILVFWCSTDVTELLPRNVCTLVQHFKVDPTLKLLYNLGSMPKGLYSCAC